MASKKREKKDKKIKKIKKKVKKKDHTKTIIIPMIEKNEGAIPVKDSPRRRKHHTHEPAHEPAHHIEVALQQEPVPSTHEKVMHAMQLLNAYKDVCTVFYLQAINDEQMREVIPCIKNALDSIQICNLCMYLIHNHSSHLKNMLSFTHFVLDATINQCTQTDVRGELATTLITCMGLAKDLGECLHDVRESL